VIDLYTTSLNEDYGFDAIAPFNGAIYDLKLNELVDEGKLVEIQGKKEPKKTVSSAFERLVSAGKRLMVVIQHNEGGTNKDLAKFMGQINSLCDKWDR
jgi:metallo-beta-lactamase family protein